MSKLISVRVAHRQATRAGGQNKHDLRHGNQPAYVDPERARRNTVIMPPRPASELRVECERRRSSRQTQRAMKKNAAIATVGIITFSREAQPGIEALPVDEQNRRFLASAQALAENMGTTLSGLVVHRDESAIHAHFQCPAVRLDGHPVSKTLGRTGTSHLQDIAASAWADLGIERGERKGDKIKRLEAEGKSQPEITAAVIHRSVRQLHHDLPREIKAAERKRQELEQDLEAGKNRVAALKAEMAEAAAKVEKNLRLVAEQHAKLDAGRVAEDKAKKRIEVYERRAEAARKELSGLTLAVEAAETNAQRLSAGIQAKIFQHQRVQGALTAAQSDLAAVIKARMVYDQEREKRNNLDAELYRVLSGPSAERTMDRIPAFRELKQDIERRLYPERARERERQERTRSRPAPGMER